MLTVAKVCCLSLLIGLAVASTVPPTGSHDINTVANKNVSTDKPTNHKTGMEHTGTVTHANHTGLTNHSNHTEHSNDTHHKDHTDDHGHGEAHIHVFTIDFTHVKYPAVFGLVVIIAGLSKLGKLSAHLSTNIWKQQELTVFIHKFKSGGRSRISAEGIQISF